MHLSQTNIYIPTKAATVDNIHFVTVAPVDKYTYKVLVIYEYMEKESLPDNGRYCSIDLGVNNLATVSSNVIAPIIVNGKPIKSINQYWNKTKAAVTSKTGASKSKKLAFLDRKRNCKVKDYFHKASRIITNHLVSNNINTLVIGYNKNWKQEVAIGRRNNQNFVQVPFLMFVNTLSYKCQLEGIRVILHEESYTSKCSFIDSEPIGKHDSYVGKRIHRGLFISKSGKTINADLNGSLNILRKVAGEFKYSVEVCSTPVIVTPTLRCA